MERSILKLTVASEADVVVAYRKAAELSELAGLEGAPVQKFAVAVSDLCRNVLKHIGTARTEFMVAAEPPKSYLEAYISSGQAQALVKQKQATSTCTASPDKPIAAATENNHVFHNTKVWLRTLLPESHKTIAASDIKQWRRQLNRQYSPTTVAKGKSQPKIKELLDYLRLLNNGVISNVEENQNYIKGIEQAHQQVLYLLQTYEEQYLQLKLVNQHLDTFAYSVSHDLKAPLRNLEGLINGFRESLEENNAADAKKWLSMLQEQVSRMDEFISGVLSSARNRSPEKQLKLVQPCALIDQVVRTLNVPEGFKVIVQKRIRELYASPVRLSQVFSNLICNAYKHHHTGKGQVKVTARTNQQKALITFKMTDDGPGIPRERQKEIFKPFKTADTNSSSDNSGLGLFIVKQIVEEAGGKIWVKPEQQGTSFYFSWPIGQPGAGSHSPATGRKRGREKTKQP